MSDAGDGYERMHLYTGCGSLAATIAATLATLGYRHVRWQPRRGLAFAAVDELRVRAIVFVDVTRLRAGYPTPQVSPSRAVGMRDACEAELHADSRRRRVRADYLALPCSGARRGWMPVTSRRGVAWAVRGQ